MVTIEELPKTKHIDGAKRWDEDRGEFVQISYLEAIGHVACFQVRQGFHRGNHYHKNKEEVLYVLRGTIRAKFRDMTTGQEEEHILREGQKISIQQGCAHVFHGVEDALVIEYSPQYYDKRDAYGVELWKL